MAVFAMVLLAAAMHALWNFAVKRESGNLSLLWIGNALAALCFLPFAAYAALTAGWEPKVLPYLLATSLIHVVYFISLTRSYAIGEISLVYPITRGIGVAGTAVLGGLLLGEKLSSPGLLGIAAVCAGILLIGLVGKGGRLAARAFVYCALTGATIACYSVVDKVGANLLRR